MHLALDGYTPEYEKLRDASFVEQFLNNFPASIGMTKITKPMVMTYHAPIQKDWGVTGVVIIAESHISIHTFPERNLVYLDVFSCMPFDADLVQRRLTEAFNLTRAVPYRMERGLEHYNEEYAQEAANARITQRA
ncbi:MAG: S-adenosylmethionine decarboxylase proenzyme [Dehalococcoidia bacterium]|nr:S-adenosylmethionine decarboxylase proenzyme [Dehalococcoidia bacterium]